MVHKHILYQFSKPFRSYLCNISAKKEIWGELICVSYVEDFLSKREIDPKRGSLLTKEGGKTGYGIIGEIFAEQ